MANRACNLLLALSLTTRLAHAAEPPGQFEGNTDIGTLLHPGSVQFDPAAKTYTISASGENMWFAKDDFHFVWKKVNGDASLSADIVFLGAVGNAHRKAVLMARQTLSTDSAYVDVAVHGDGLTSLQGREETGAPTREVGINAAHPTRVRLEKRGDYFYMSLGGRQEDLRFAGGSLKVKLTTPFYLGIGVCAHDKNVVEKAVFSHVQIEEKPAAAKPAPYSTLETLSVTSTDRRVAYVAPRRLSHASWAADGAALLFHDQNSMHTVPARAPGAKPEPVAADAQRPAAADNPYVAADHAGLMQITLKPRDGAANDFITADDFNNCFPQPSPDGKQVAFLSYEKDTPGCAAEKDVTLRVINLADHKIRVLARFIGGPGTFDGSPWSPDGKSLTYVSYQFLPPR